MIKLYHSLGPEKFPLNEQTFYPNHTQMVSNSDSVFFFFFYQHYKVQDVALKKQNRKKTQHTLPEGLFNLIFIIKI